MANQGEIKYNLKFKAWISPASTLWEEALAETSTKEEFDVVFRAKMKELLKVMYE